MTDTPHPNGPVSWRDVYRAVNDMETRVMARLDDLDKQMSESRRDHETRIRYLEGERLRDNAARAQTNFIANASKGFVVAVVAVANGVVAVIVWIANHTP